MNFWLEILIGVAVAIFLYFVFRVLLVIFAGRELDRSERIARKSDVIEVFADVDSLEYYVRCALTAASDKIEVVVYIRKDSADKDDMLDILMKLKRNHRNLSYRLI